MKDILRPKKFLLLFIFVKLSYIQPLFKTEPKIKFLTEKKIKIRYLNCVKCNIRIKFKKVFYAIINKIS